MLSEEEKAEIIEGFVDGTLSDAQRDLLQEAKDSGDSLFSQAMDARAVASVLKAEQMVKLKTELKSAYQASLVEKKPVLMMKLLVAASISIVILSAVTYFYFSFTSSDFSDAFNKFYRPYPIASITRGTGELQSSIIENFQKKKFDQVIDQIQSMKKENVQRNYQLMLIYGDCLLSTDQLQSAQEVFRLVKESKDREFSDYGNWYLSLTLLKSENIKEAKVILSHIINQKMIHSPEAKSLLEELENN